MVCESLPIIQKAARDGGLKLERRRLIVVGTVALGSRRSVFIC